MLALTVADPRLSSGGCAPDVEPDPIVSLLGHLGRLLDAQYIIALKFDLKTRTAEIVATVGRAIDVGSLERAVMGLIHRIDIVRPHSNDLSAIEVGRLRLDAEHGEALVVEVDLGRASLLLVAIRAPETSPFTINAERSARRMGGWISDYARLWWRQRSDCQRSDRLHAALDILGVAIFVLDGQGRPIDANHAAEILLEAGDGLRKVGGMLTAVSLEDSARLQTAIAHAGSPHLPTDRGDQQQAPVLSIRRKGLRPLSVAVMRGGPAGAARNAVDQFVVIQVVDPHHDIETALLSACALYGFTRAETRLAKLMIGGASLTEASTQLRIQAPTARTYLKQIFLKTGTNRQAALVHLLLTSVVRTIPSIELLALQ